LQDYYFVNKVTHPEAVAREKGEEGLASQSMGAFGLDFGLDFKEAQVRQHPGLAFSSLAPHWIHCHAIQKSKGGLV
jgi:hypothetical protein